MKVKRIELTAFLFLSIITLYSAGVSLYQHEFAHKFVRLRVIASENDMISQFQKLNVRDEILTFFNSFSEEVQNADNAKTVLLNHMPEIRTRIQSVLGEQPFLIQLSETRYPSRFYQNFSLPAGRYIGLQIHIGRAEGKNWWCVLYPALCTDPIDDGRYDSTTFSFKCVELISALCSRLWE